MRNLSVIVPFWNGHRTIHRLLDSLPDCILVTVVDDYSNESLQIRRRGVTVVRPKIKGFFAGAVNTGIELCRTDVLVLNQDVWFSGYEWVNVLERARVEYGMVGDGVFSNPAWPNGYVQGTFMFMRRDAIEATGMLNQRDYPLWGCTAEWQLRMCRKGFRSLPLPAIPGMQHEQRREGQFGSAMTDALRREPGRRAEFLRTPPAVSVVVSCYNNGRFLPDTISSLIGGQTCLGTLPGQTLQDFEVIIVDDGSADDTARICDEFADNWKGIRVIHHPIAGGTAAAKRTGIQAAFGRAVIVIGAEDVMEPHWLETLYRKWEHHPDEVICDDAVEMMNGRRIRYSYTEDVCNQMHASILFAKDGWQQAGGKDMKDIRKHVQERIAGRLAGMSEVVNNWITMVLTIYEMREDLQRAYPEVRQGDYVGILDWSIRVIRKEVQDSSYDILVAAVSLPLTEQLKRGASSSEWIERN
jgi:glycosyltransferase involved in cell wall biosynthesis